MRQCTSQVLLALSLLSFRDDDIVELCIFAFCCLAALERPVPVHEPQPGRKVDSTLSPSSSTWASFSASNSTATSSPAKARWWKRACLSLEESIGFTLLSSSASA